MREKEVFRACGLDDVYPALHPHNIHISEVARQLAASGDAFAGNQFLDSFAEDDDPGGYDNASCLLTALSHLERVVGITLLRQRLEPDHLIVEISVRAELKPASLTCIDLVLLITEKLLALGLQYGIDLERPLGPPRHPWGRESTHVVQRPAPGPRLVAEQEPDAPPLVESLMSTRLGANQSEQLHTMLQATFAGKLSDLIAYCNVMVYRISEAIAPHPQHKLMLLVGDLCQVPLDNLLALFLPHAPLLASLTCKTVLSVPAELFHHSQFRLVLPCFGARWEVPALRLHDVGGKAHYQCMLALRNIVLAHVAPDLFDPPELLDRLVLHSGGCLRDLIHLVASASDKALDRNAKVIAACDVEKATTLHRKGYAAILGRMVDEDGNPVPVSEVEGLVADLCKRLPAHVLVECDLARRLLLGQGILCFGEGEFGVHPVLRAALAERRVDRDVGDGALNQDPHQSSPATSY